MGKKAAASKRSTKFKGDPVLDQLAVVNARSVLTENLIGMGWRLALMVLLPIFIGVQLDKKFDSSPSLTLAAFFIAVFGAGVLIARAYSEIQAEQQLEDARKAKRSKRKVNRSTNA